MLTAPLTVAKKIALTAATTIAVVATAFGTSATASASQSQVSRVRLTLSKSIAPSPRFLVANVCGTSGPSNTTACLETIIKAIDNARRTEPVHAVRTTFNVTAFEKLTYAEQLFVIADMERTARGIAPIAGLTTQLNSLASAAASGQRDPAAALPLRLNGGGVATYYGSNWAEGTANALGADYYWMYDDGPNSPNADCPRAGAPGCWGHRENVLGAYANTAFCPSGDKVTTVMGAAEVTSKIAFSPSIAEIFTNSCGSSPTMYFTWTQAQRLVLG